MKSEEFAAVGDCGNERGAAGRGVGGAGEGGGGRRLDEGEAQADGGCAWDGWRGARSGPRLSALREPRNRRLGPVGRAVAVSLQSLPAHLQHADQNADGAPAQEGQVGRSCPGDDRGQEPGRDRGTVRRASDNGVSLAASAFCARRLTTSLERLQRHLLFCLATGRLQPSRPSPGLSRGSTRPSTEHCHIRF